MEWFRLFSRWVKVIMGRSYYHQPQHLGKAFRPEKLVGYFNDLTGKTRWIGAFDEHGIPVNLLADGRRIHFATTIVQKALGHWDQWLLTKDGAHEEEFLKLCGWLLMRQDRNGGWPVWSELDIPASSPYSAMTQGECISAFMRAWKLTSDSAYIEGASCALRLMCRPIEKGGTAIFEGQFLFLEELPIIPRSSVLNGWIFALFGLYDFWLATNDKDSYKYFILSFNTLKYNLRKYDTGYWSYYDMRGHLSSPFYHDLHINQLIALSMIDNDILITNCLNLWIRYRNSCKNRSLAFVVKSIQKLRDPGEAVIIQ